MNFIGIATIVAIPIYVIMWVLMVVLTTRYHRKLKTEYPQECEARGGLKYIGGFLRKKEYEEFGSDEFIAESEFLRKFSKIWWIVFLTTIALLAVFFIIEGKS